MNLFILPEELREVVMGDSDSKVLDPVPGSVRSKSSVLPDSERTGSRTIVDVHCIGPVVGRGAQQTTADIVTEPPQLLVLRHPKTPSGGLSCDHMDLGASKLVTATLEMRGELRWRPVVKQI